MEYTESSRRVVLSWFSSVTPFEILTLRSAAKEMPSFKISTTRLVDVTENPKLAREPFEAAMRRP